MTPQFATFLWTVAVVILTGAMLLNTSAMIAMIYRQLMLWRELREFTRLAQQAQILQQEQTAAFREAMKRHIAAAEIDKGDTKH